jgi:hypothetical protein
MSQKPLITSGARIVTEVGFDSYVRKVVERHNTKTIRLGHDVDNIEERPMGILVTKKEKGVTYRALYPWSRVTDVRYEPIPDEVAVKETELLG